MLHVLHTTHYTIYCEPDSSEVRRAFVAAEGVARLVPLLMPGEQPGEQPYAGAGVGQGIGRGGGQQGGLPRRWPGDAGPQPAAEQDGQVVAVAAMEGRRRIDEDPLERSLRPGGDPLPGDPLEHSLCAGSLRGGWERGEGRCEAQPASSRNTSASQLQAERHVLRRCVTSHPLTFLKPPHTP